MTAQAWLAIVIALLAVISGCAPDGERPAHAGGPTITLEPRPTGRLGAAGDPANGARLYRVHCSSCHGAGGGGDGPAARFVYPSPRDHTDPAHMNRRTDQELHDTIAAGGPALGMSSLMPRWDDIFGGHQIWDLVAHVRSLHQPVASLVEGSTRLELHEIVLSDDALASATRATGSDADSMPRKLTYFAPAEPGVEGPFVVFGRCRVGGLDVPFGISVDASSRLVRARTFPLVVVHHRGFALRRTVDDLLSSLVGRDPRSLEAPVGPADGEASIAAPLVAAVRRLALEFDLARRQETEDERVAAERLATYRAHPDQVGSGERLFLMACAACHGPTGKGASVTSFPGLRSRNLSDGAHLNARTDDDLAFVIAQGGEKARLSSAMPGFSGVFDGAKLREIVAYVRTLARPRRGVGRAP